MVRICREANKNVGETTVEAVKEEIVAPTKNAINSNVIAPVTQAIKDDIKDKVKVANAIVRIARFGMQLLDDGTISIGLGGNVAAGFGATGGYNLVIDKEGNYGLLSTVGVIGGSPSAGAGVNVQITNAPDIYYLEGLGMIAGGSFAPGIPASVGGDVLLIPNSSESTMYCGTSIQVSVSTPLPEMHAGVTYSTLSGTGNVFDLWDSFVE